MIFQEYYMRNPKQIFAANHKIDTVRLESSSGGVFFSMAVYVLNHGGAVIGASYKGTDVQHVIVRSEEELSSIRKSKYAPSSIASIKNILPSLVDEPLILFSGTPCQIKGLQLFLSRSKDDRVRSLKQSILWVEVACHGVPTKKSYQEYIKVNHIRSIDFRCKRNGWRTSEIMIERMDGSVSYELPSSNSFYQNYINNSNVRKSCLQCKSKYFSSGADVTLADFWGVEAFAKDLDDDKGTSLVLLHTKKGIDIWKNVRDDFYTRKVSLLHAIKWNPCIVRSANSPLSSVERQDEYKTKVIGLLYSFYKSIFR